MNLILTPFDGDETNGYNTSILPYDPPIQFQMMSKYNINLPSYH